jgi:dimethylargininase
MAILLKAFTELCWLKTFALQNKAMFTRAIVRPPSPNFSEGLTISTVEAPDYERALAQHDAYCAALERCGLTLTKLEPDPDYPDSTFVEDTAILLTPYVGSRHANHTQSAQGNDVGAKALRLTLVLTRPGAPSRTGEVESMRKVLADFFPSLPAIQAPGTLDGGDVCEAGNHFFIGISERTNKAGAQQLAEMLASVGHTASFVDIRGLSVPRAATTGSPAQGILHLKSGIAYLSDNRLVLIESLASRREFRGYDIVRVKAGEEYAANCVRVNDYVLVAAGYPAFERKLRRLGYQAIVLDMTEFQKMDGGLSCLSLRF